MTRIDRHTPLTPDQKRLVEDNLGLVGVQLRRYAQPWSAPRSNREWEDLFQEGCLALMDAARNHPATCGIPFAAYALPRIRASLGIAIERLFSNIRTPLPRRGRRRPDDDGRDHASRNYPQQVPGDRELDRRPCAARHDPGFPHAGETLGDRVRTRLDRAVRKAAADVSAKPDRRGDLAALVTQIVDGRLTRPDEESRCSLRGLAEKTHSTYGRVVDCEKRLLARVRHHLHRDPVFAVLRQSARDHAGGIHAPIDADLEQTLNERLVAEWGRRYRLASDEQQARALLHLVRHTPGGDAALAQDLFATLPSSGRELLVESMPEAYDHPANRAPEDDDPRPRPKRRSAEPARVRGPRPARPPSRRNRHADPGAVRHADATFRSAPDCDKQRP